MAATMQDVARLAGVSPKTVSNVVNDHPHIRPATRARVEQAIADLGYELNVTARNLRRGRTGLISLALPELKLPYFAELADSVIEEAGRVGLGVLVEQTNYDREREWAILQGARRAITDGVIYSPLELGTEDVEQVSADFPLVLLGERIFSSHFDHVTMNNVGAAKAATAHLLELGCRRVLVVGVHAQEHVGSAALRLRGYLEAHEEAGITPDPRLLAETRLWHRDTGAAALRAALADGVEFDGVFAMNDAMAMGVLRALAEARIRVPDEVAVVGYDDIEDASYTQPSLSSIQPGRPQIAREAVRLLMTRIDERLRGGERAPTQAVYADFELMVRESSTR